MNAFQVGGPISGGGPAWRVHDFFRLFTGNRRAVGKGAVVGGGLRGGFGAGGLGGVWGLLLGGEGVIGASLSVRRGVFRRLIHGDRARLGESHLKRFACAG